MITCRLIYYFNLVFGIVNRIQRIFVIFISAWEAKTQTKHWMKSCFISSQEDGNEDDESMPNQTQSIYLKRKSFSILINLYIYASNLHYHTLMPCLWFQRLYHLRLQFALSGRSSYRLWILGIITMDTQIYEFT